VWRVKAYLHSQYRDVKGSVDLGGFLAVCTVVHLRAEEVSSLGKLLERVGEASGR